MQQQKRVLIAIPRKVLRKGILAIFAEEQGTKVFEAATYAELKIALAQDVFDLIIVHQAINADLALLPKGDFILLTAELDPMKIFTAYLYGARAYLWEYASESVLRQTLFLDKGVFLTDETISAALVEYLTGHTLFSIRHEVLSSREQEVFQLLWQGLHSVEIAQRLHISESTFKTYVKRIYEKVRINRYQMKILSLLARSENMDFQPPL